MAKYLGEFPVNLADTEFRDYKRSDWAMYYIGSYGQIDGSHHKQWVLDQVARILSGVKVNVVEARWDDGNAEYRVTLCKPTKRYNAWVKEMKGELEDCDQNMTTTKV
jgi:hypothetical protein